jgi:hypothetical protein
MNIDANITTPEAPTARPTEVIPDEPATPDVPSARELRIATEREDSNRRIQLAREGHSRSEIEAMMASNSREQSIADSESTPAVRPISELTTSEEFSEERNRLDQLVQQNTITRQEQLDLLGELRDRERELAEAAYQAQQFAGPPVPTATPTEETPAPPEVPIARTPDESEPVTANVSTSENYEQRLAELSEKYYNDNPPIAPTESLKQSARQAANLRAREELQKLDEITSLTTPEVLTPPVTANVAVPELPNETAIATPAAPAVAQTVPRTSESTIETPTPAQVTAAITPAPVAQPTQPTTPVVTTTTAQANNANVNNDISDIMSLLSYKLDAVIALLDTGVTIQDRILLESRS